MLSQRDLRADEGELAGDWRVRMVLGMAAVYYWNEGLKALGLRQRV